MKAIRRVTVKVSLPAPLAGLADLAGNLRWSWHEPTKALFRSISPAQWRDSEYDPVAMLADLDPARLAELAADQGFVDWVNRERDQLRSYLDEPRWFQLLEADKPDAIAYFSPEFGIAAALPQYSGGLGILAGDHLKSASDLGLPLVGVGLFYRAGYFSQTISSDGWQQESYPVLDPDGLPLTVLRDAAARPAIVELVLPEAQVLRARIWQAAVGRVTLLLLDTDIVENPDELRAVTDRLYGGGGEHRLLQELLLGIGGVRAIDLWCELTGAPRPTVFHTNEGHAGFQGLERISQLRGRGFSVDEALQIVRAGTVFTTHTPVPAGIDRFEVGLVSRYLKAGLLPGVTAAEALHFGAEADAAFFNMAHMGLRLAQRANGVSKLHGAVSREMFVSLWPGFDTQQVPITSVTNGVHAPTWTDPLLVELARSELGTGDTTTADWASPQLTDGMLWNVRNALRHQLVEDARARLRAAWLQQNSGSAVPAWLGEVLDPGVLTIGFARRVPTYKRLTLMLNDPERLKAILMNPDRPVQFVVAGKSHPADDEGKRLIQRFVQFASDPELRRRIVFLPDYDIGMAQLLYPGTDVWLNNPLRPLEACGTSGMKAALNGGLNLSILDGWWDEYFDGDNGWAIPTAGDSLSAEERDALEAAALYDLIEHQLVPRFYERNDDGLPIRWLASIRHSLATLSPQLSADRMVREYTERLYLPAAEAAVRIWADDGTPARELAAWKQRVRAAWPNVEVRHVDTDLSSRSPLVGDRAGVRASVYLDGLDPAEVAVQLVYGRADSADQIVDAKLTQLELRSTVDGTAEFGQQIELARPGTFGYTIRVVPRHPLLASDAELGLQTLAG